MPRHCDKTKANADMNKVQKLPQTTFPGFEISVKVHNLQHIKGEQNSTYFTKIRVWMYLSNIIVHINNKD